MVRSPRVDWLAMVAILVTRYHQPLEQAWRFTLREYFAVTHLEAYLNKADQIGFDRQRAGEMAQQLRDMGIEV